MPVTEVTTGTALLKLLTDLTDRRKTISYDISEILVTPTLKGWVVAYQKNLVVKR